MSLRHLFLITPFVYADNTVAQSLLTTAESPWFTTLLLALCLVLLTIIFWLKGDKVIARRYESELNKRYKALEKRLFERGEKLRSINDQLYEEITKHENTEVLLKETQDYMQNIINSMPSILIGVTDTGLITHWNQAASHATDIHYKQALGNNLFTLAPSLLIEKRIIDKAIEKHTPQKLEAVQTGHGSKASYRDITIYPLASKDSAGAAIRIDDVTARVNLENMMIQNEKLSSLGELAAGVAHEINNPMGIVLQGVQNIKRRLSDELSSNNATAAECGIALADVNHYLESRKITQFIDDIQDAGERATEIVTNMLRFARAQHQQLENVDIKALIINSLQMAEQNLAVMQIQDDLEIILEAHLPEETIDIACSPIEIQQVLLNILSNAFHSFGDEPSYAPLTVTVGLQQKEKDAVITIQDNGAGMDVWTQKHIFDPFFTTKEVGKGTGLGLSVSYYIVTERHRGSITVDSKIGEGTTFTICLPREMD